MKNNHNSIHLPELILSFDSLKNHLKNIYKIDINMSNIDYDALEKTNVWGLFSEDIRTIEEEGSFEANHWVFSKVGNEYEAVYDGLYMDVYKNIDDLMSRQNVHYYEYNADKSTMNGEETFVDAQGNEREYKEFAKNGKDLKEGSVPKGYKLLVSGKIGSILELNLYKNGVDIITVPDSKIKGYQTIYIRRNAENINKAKAVITGNNTYTRKEWIAANGAEVTGKIKVAFYSWGQYQEDEEIDLIDLPETRLGEDDLSGFNIREEDVDKVFYALDRDIDTDEDGTSVKRAYATNTVKADNGKDVGRVTDKMTIDFIKTLEKDGIMAPDSHKNKTAVNSIKSIISMSKKGFSDYIDKNPNQKVSMIYSEYNDWIQTYKAANGKAILVDYYKDKQSGEIFTEQEMLEAVDKDDNLDSFYLIGKFESKEEAGKNIAANGKSFLEDTRESIKGYSHETQKTYVFSVGMPVKWVQAGRTLSGTITAIKKPKFSANNNNEWSVHVKSDVSGKPLYTKVYFLLNDFNRGAMNNQLPYDKKNTERLAFIGELMMEGERINDEEDVMEMRADIADVNESTSEQKQYWVINSLIDFVQNSPKIDYFVSKAKSLGWDDQYANGGKVGGKWRKMDTYSDKAADGKIVEGAKLEPVHISRIAVGDTIERDGKLTTVNANNIKRDPSMGITLFGDSYSLGTKPVYKVVAFAANGKVLANKYKLGDEYSSDFDYGGMFDMVLKVNTHWTVADLIKLKDSLVDVNYTSIAIALGAGISFMEAGDKNNAEVVFNKVRHLMKKEMVEQYVSRYMNDDMSVIFDTIGMDMPVELEGDEYHQTMDDAREVATAYFMKHPNEMKNKFGDPYKFANGGPVNENKKISDFEDNEIVNVDGKEYKVRLSYNLRLNSTNINVIDNTGYPWNIEKVPFQVMTKLHSMFDRLIHAYLEKGKTWKAADGAEIDSLVNDWKAIKNVLSENTNTSGTPNDLKILDIETNTVWDPIFVDYEEKFVIMENKEYGRTRNTFDKVKFFFAATPSSSIKKPEVPKVTLSPAEMMAKKSVTPAATSTSTPTPVVDEKKYVEPGRQTPVVKVDPSEQKTIWPKVLQEMWAEAKGSGMILISPEYMQKIEEALFDNLSGLTYRSMVDEVSYWLDSNQLTLRSKPFMKKIRETLKNNPA